MNDNIIGRVGEQKLLAQLCEDDMPRLIAVYGRRCVGKTFQVLTKTRDALRFVFITTYGLQPNMYANSIPNSITMEELFA